MENEARIPGWFITRFTTCSLPTYAVESSGSGLAQMSFAQTAACTGVGAATTVPAANIAVVTKIAFKCGRAMTRASLPPRGSSPTLAGRLGPVAESLGDLLLGAVLARFVVD